MKTWTSSIAITVLLFLYCSPVYSQPLHRSIPFQGDGVQLQTSEVLETRVLPNGNLKAKVVPGQAAFITLDVSDIDIDFSQEDSLVFSWKVEGAGLEHFMVKIRNYPLAGGMEAAYMVWQPNDGPVAKKWRRSRISINEPDYDNWGGEPDKERRYVTFRIQSKPGADLTLYLANQVVLPKTFSVDIGTAFTEDGRAYVPIDVLNESGSEQTVLVQIKDGSEQQLLLGAGKTGSVTGTVDLNPLGWGLKEALDAVFSHLYIGLKDSSESRQERIIKIVKPISLPERPRLLVNDNTIDCAREKVKNLDWAAAYWEGLKKRTDGLLEQEVKIPDRGGNWFHWYTCTEHCAGLKTGKEIGEWQWEHICPVGGEVFIGDRSKASTDYDACALSSVHHRWSDAILDLGLAYQYTKDESYAFKARDILLEYANQYASYPLHNVHGEPKTGGGKIGAQSLDESVWTIPVAQGADMIWETLSEEERTVLREKLFRPIADEVLLPHHLNIHNIQCWKNSAVGCIGFLLGDEDLIWEAINNPQRGFRKQMEKGIMEDGLWHEGSWGYHFYTMNASWPLVEAANLCGIDLYSTRFKMLFYGPLKFALPDGSLPSFNDSGNARLSSIAHLYELAHSRYKEKDFLFPLSYSNRRNLHAFLFGSEEKIDASPTVWESRNLPQTGYGILAEGTGKEATWICLKYGPHGGGHGHPDKLNFVLYGNSQIVGIDPGSTRYGHPMQQEWYKTTVAHNTLVVNESNQAPSEGRCLSFGTEKGVDYIMAEAGPIYEGVRFVRTVLLLEKDILLFADLVTCETESTLDILYHHRGKWALPDEVQPFEFPHDKPGYMHLQNSFVLKDLSLRIEQEGEGSCRISLPARDQSLTLIVADGPWRHADDRVPCLVMRKKDEQASFVWAVSLKDETVDLDYTREGNDIVNISATCGGKSWKVKLDATDGEVLIR